jgi:release factor glutamine methyltransferase
MPYQYALKKILFCEVKIMLKKSVLIPRVETEELVSWFIKKLNLYKSKCFKIIDFCSGSGCIGIALLKFFENSYCTAFDICHESVKLSSLNASLNKVKDRYKVYHKDILKLKKNKKYDILISNPPYISLEEYNSLDKSVLFWEDANALTDKKNGYSIILHILLIGKKKLHNNAVLIIEIDHSYADFILTEAKKIYSSCLVFLWIDQYEKSRAIVIVKGIFISLFTER